MTWVGTGVSLGTAAYGALQEDDTNEQAQRLARAQGDAEIDRQQRIDTNIGLINAAFDQPGRKREIGNFMTALRGYYGDDLGRAKKVATRKLKFALAGSGLTGGSVDIDKHRTLGEEAEDAALQAESKVQEQGADLAAADEQARLSLIQQARGGLGATDALRRGQSALETNLAGATSAARGQTLGDMFTDTTATHRAQVERRERRRGLGYVASRADLYGGK